MISPFCHADVVFQVVVSLAEVTVVEGGVHICHHDCGGLVKVSRRRVVNNRFWMGLSCSKGGRVKPVHTVVPGCRRGTLES